MKSAVTVSLVAEAKGGPFVYWDGLADAFENAKALGYDGVEIFAPGPDAVDRDELRRLIADSGLSVAAVGTGAGMVIHGLSLTDPDGSKRSQAIAFVNSMIDFGAEFNAPAIIGSMQGRWGGGLDRQAALGLLTDSLNETGQYAATQNVSLIYEPLNRYETNLVNTMAVGVELLSGLKTDNVKLLADLFHMNIEESDVAEAVRTAGNLLGHVHFVDSNRLAAGLGHTSFEPIAGAIQETGYEGYLSVEGFPIPDSETAARKTIDAYGRYFG